jgi:hypothetical protein
MVHRNLGRNNEFIGSSVQYPQVDAFRQRVPWRAYYRSAALLGYRNQQHYG